MSLRPHDWARRLSYETTRRTPVDCRAHCGQRTSERVPTGRCRPLVPRVEHIRRTRAIETRGLPVLARTLHSMPASRFTNVAPAGGRPHNRALMPTVTGSAVESRAMIPARTPMHRRTDIRQAHTHPHHLEVSCCHAPDANGRHEEVAARPEFQSQTSRRKRSRSRRGRHPARPRTSRLED